MKKIKKSKETKTFDPSSFDELRKEFGLKPIVWRTNDLDKLKGQRERFQSKHLCPVCKQPMKYIEGTNIFCCANNECKGFTKEIREIIDEETEEKEIIRYTPFHTLDEKSAVIANNIFVD